VRSTSFSLSLLVVAVAAAIVVGRLGRALGPMGILLAVVLVVVALILLRNLVDAVRASSAGPDRRQAPTKNVTPHEPALPPGEGSSEESTAGRVPSVIVIDPPDRSEQLAAKLQALDGLRADGLVSDDEYETKRAQLIADF
jgi:putative oligomerization/nucleic acid binding protein